MSRDRVLRAAIGIADEGGLEALSMRKLAQELGVEAMSVYHYVASKDEILDGILNFVITEFELAVGGPDWKAAIRRSAGRTKSSKPTSEDTGFPGSPSQGTPPMSPNASGAPGRMRTRSISTLPPICRTTSRV